MEENRSKPWEKQLNEIKINKIGEKKSKFFYHTNARMAVKHSNGYWVSYRVRKLLLSETESEQMKNGWNPTKRHGIEERSKEKRLDE